MSVSIRLAQVADIDQLVRLTAQLGYDITTDEASARLRRVLERPDQRFFIADDRRPVGWLHAARVEYFESGACVVINGLVVDSECRGAGVGRLSCSRRSSGRAKRVSGLCGCGRAINATARTASTRGKATRSSRRSWPS